MPGDPADISRAPVDVLVLHVEHELGGGVGAGRAGGGGGVGGGRGPRGGRRGGGAVARRPRCRCSSSSEPPEGGDGGRSDHVGARGRVALDDAALVGLFFFLCVCGRV